MGDYPTLFSLLEAFERQSTYLCSSEAASQQDANDSIISLAADTALVEPGKEALALFRGQPVAHIPCFFTALNPPDSRRKIGTPKPAIGSLVCQPSDGRQAEVDSRGRVMSLFETDPVSRDYGLIESEPRLPAVPLDEFANRVIVRPLGTLRRQAVQDGGLRLFEIRQLQDGFWIAFPFDFGHSSSLPQLAFDAFRRMLGCFLFLIPFVIVGRQPASLQAAIRSGDN
jgi:hypothetical protein